MSEPLTAREGEDQFRDGLLWVGGSYRFIDCLLMESCAIPAKPSDLSATRGQAKCFVHEAEWRGISRKVPGVPKWAVPGKTRIFLAHRGGLTAAQGEVFGYFVLHRVEVLGEADTSLAPPDVQQMLPWGRSQDEGELTVTVYDAITGRPLRGAEVEAQATGSAPSLATRGNHSYRLVLPVQEYRLRASMHGYKPTELDGIRAPSGKRRKVAVYLQPQPDASKAVTGKEGEERTEKCPDGSVIVTHRFKNGKWHPTRQKCSALPACEEGAFKWSICSDGTLIPVRICHEGKWKDTGVRCKKERPDDGEAPEPTPINVEPFALHRSCSLRLRPGAVYLVDALCAAINECFAATLNQNGLPEQYKNARSDGQRWDLVLAGRKAFADIATRLSHTWKPAYKIPNLLAGRVEHRGELVLFKEPVIFGKDLRAGFRGLQRINGDRLLADAPCEEWRQVNGPG